MFAIDTLREMEKVDLFHMSSNRGYAAYSRGMRRSVDGDSRRNGVLQGAQGTEWIPWSPSAVSIGLTG